ncbi:hypothetical protein PG985_012178 [Apiospora marii]|uniref:Uncharacterized protein n=1 Tax=Apiospora marii TaxID=335849 RepID=A0ABR1RE22_9PEZI
MSQQDIIKALQDYTTCDVSDALCKLKYHNGGFLPGLTMWSPQRQDGPTKIVGPAYTVKYVPVDDPAPKHPTHYVRASTFVSYLPRPVRNGTADIKDTQIDSVPAGAVVFVSAPAGTPNAVYGGLMSTRARALGAVGSVVDGRFRDVQEQRALDYPVFARDVGTAPPAPLLKVAGVNVPVTLQQQPQGEEGMLLTVRPGDYLIGDVNGVVVLPAEVAEQALSLMRKQVEADEQMAVAIQGGMGFSEASKKFRS